MKPAIDLASAGQRNASNPAHSAWVSANAGSGKTHVLTQRVIRLLLAGAPPSHILCLTFTKAAAANMADRVFHTLARWPTLPDAALASEIEKLGATVSGRADLDAARRLFARVIETPGGLKIQTIHAFCERVLHLFPFEANVPAGFRPFDEREATQAWEEAEAIAFASAPRDPELSGAIARLADHADAATFRSLVRETSRLGEALTRHGDPDVYAARLGARLGLRAGATEEIVAREIRDGGGGPPQWRDWAAALDEGSTNDGKLASALRAAAAAGDPNEALGFYQAVFLTDKGSSRKTLVTQTLARRRPALPEALSREQERVIALLDQKRAAKAVARSRDLYRIAQSVEINYRRTKAAQGALDFDDLIGKTAALFERADAAWVLFKLDRGVEHILVDEAQDTSERQWRILEKLAEDFLSGAGAGSPKRTLFAVGDEKQSIFSFQGAAPHLFDLMRATFAKRLREADRPFVNQQLSHSFRSAPAVLQAIDSVFAVEEVWRGVSAGDATAPAHSAILDRLPGVVEIWPSVTGDAPSDPEDWSLPVDAQRMTHPAVRLADRIAAVIASWIAPGSPERVRDPRTGEIRPIRPADILILVRQRGPMFDAITRSLRRVRVDAAGADRLVLAEHIAVLDLCAAARAALQRDDDLSLAAVLKSPLLGLDEAALMRLAPRRKGALADALAADPEFANAQARVERWRERAARSGPFAFFAELLGGDGGRRALTGRLGAEASDAIDEFLARALAHESTDAPSLHAFLREIEGADSEIKRDMEAAGAGVRVMTVHAAKGLEAPIVFLPDTHSAPSGRHDPSWLTLAPPHAGAPPLYVTGWDKDDSEIMAVARGEARAAAAGEHRRLLYVALTRAAQRLIVAGYEGGRKRPPDSWWNLIEPGLRPLMSEAQSWWAPEEALLRLGRRPDTSDVAPRDVLPAAADNAPDWVRRPAPREVSYGPVSPSARPAGPISETRRARLEEGHLAHILIQSLPGLSAAEREPSGRAYLLRRGAQLPADRHEPLLARILALIARADLAPLFAPESRAEADVATTLALRDGRKAQVSGRVDRLVERDAEVWIADFKSGVKSRREAYERQLALYRAAVAPLFPAKCIRAFLIWLDDGTLEELSSESLDAALENWRRDGGT